MKKKALNKSAFLIPKKKGGQEMITLARNIIIVNELDIIKLTSSDRRRVLATINKFGLLYIEPLYLTPRIIRLIKQFMNMYTVLGFYNQTSERIYKEYFM